MYGTPNKNYMMQSQIKDEFPVSSAKTSSGTPIYSDRYIPLRTAFTPLLPENDSPESAYTLHLS